MPNHTPPKVDPFIVPDRLTELIRLAREEDLGPDGLDVTSELFVPAGLQSEASVVARKPGRLAGVVFLPRSCRRLTGRYR